MDKDKITILHLLDGAKEARGLTVVIDVFRAFTVEVFAYAAGAEKIIPVGGVDEAFQLHRSLPGSILAGERNGIMVEGFDYGNAPSSFEFADLHGKTMIHTTSAGVQGLTACSNADEILTGALVNAKAIARYIKMRDPEHVSLVAMGWNAKRRTEEDELCAEYLRSLLIDEPMLEIQQNASELRHTEGKKFFDPAQAEVFPRRDFDLCTMVDHFDGVIRVVKKGNGLDTEWVEVPDNK